MKIPPAIFIFLVSSATGWNNVLENDSQRERTQDIS
jgi:hypothetical protein